ncbi:hypothetical protein HPP92_026659 [Vanilla planifolia]|uniref:Strictosidine synthase conserved region domain-containing protein n=1 Tax=Vanilla planifolia TaxID=51239 RepID=A0A835PF79_VANPL|nr:hypothetical protein HPP92_026659 [Vanilla planifolia]
MHTASALLLCIKRDQFPMAVEPSASPRRANPFHLFILAPLALALVLVLAGRRVGEGFDPAPLPTGAAHLGPSAKAEEEHQAVLGASERIGEGVLPGPEDFAYDEEEALLYTGCEDGWIRRLRLGSPEKDAAAVVVEDWVRVGGRPLGIALAPDGGLVVAESSQGLLKVNKDGEVKLLTSEAEGRRFKLTDGVDVASNGVIYFTDASYKYDLMEHHLDIFEGRPYGRLLSFDPSTNQTTVLARDLYFANGVSLSSDQKSIIFCETPLRRCRRYYIEGEKKGKVEGFVENLPGFPDNIRYDGKGRYWIALAAGRSLFWDLLMKYPLLRKLKVNFGLHVRVPSFGNSGLLGVSLRGKPVALLKDADLSLVTVGQQIGKHLYYGSLVESHVLRVDVSKLV